MFTDPSAIQSAAWFFAKLMVIIGLLLAWVWVVRRRVIPFFETIPRHTPERKGDSVLGCVPNPAFQDKPVPVAKFPTAWVVVMVLVSAAGAWACSWEMAFREVQDVSSPLPERRLREVQPVREVRPATAETLAQKSERLRAQAESDRASTKAAYEQVPARSK